MTLAFDIELATSIKVGTTSFASGIIDLNKLSSSAVEADFLKLIPSTRVALLQGEKVNARPLILVRLRTLSSEEPLSSTLPSTLQRILRGESVEC